MILTVGARVKDNESNVYVLDNIIGEGGFATVYKAHRERDGEIFAIKTLRASFGDAQELQLFQNEIKTAETIDSENVIKYFYAHEGEQFQELPPYIIMEYAEGGTLADLIQQQKERGLFFDNELIIDYCLQLANGMKAINKHFVHRDIKPENVLVKGGKLKISDFGLSKISEDSTRMITFKGFGTEKYAAPEIWNNSKHTIQIDIYSMGIVFYEIATLNYPYNMDEVGNDYQKAHLYLPVKNPLHINASLPASFCSILTKMLEKPSQKRFKQWSDIVDGIEVKPIYDDTLNNAIEKALNKSTERDLRIQEAEARQRQKEKEFSDHCSLIKGQYENNIFGKIEEFSRLFNERYSGGCYLIQESRSYGKGERFFYKISTPSQKTIVIDTEILFKENHKRRVSMDRYFGYQESRVEEYIPQCDGVDVLAWSNIYDEKGKGFNLLLLKSEESAYGDWFILENKNSAFNTIEREEPFGFKIEELPKEIGSIRALHIYDSTLQPFEDKYLTEFLVEYA